MPVTPGLQLPYGIQPVNPVPVDSYSGPFTGSVDTVASAITAANSGIPSALRFKSMEVRLLVGGKSRKFWYKDGISDSDLVEFIGGSGGYSGSDIYFYVTGSTGSASGSLFEGNLTVSGSIKSFLGLSGSLTKLTDGSSYLIGSGSVDITSASNGSVTVFSPVYVLNEPVTFSPTLGIWYGTLAYAPNPTSSLMLFHNGQLLTQGALDDYSLSGVTIQMSNEVNMESGDKIFAMYQR